MLSIDGRRMVSATGWWDPAYGAPGRGDASVVAAVFVDGEGGYWLHGIRYLQPRSGAAQARWTRRPSCAARWPRSRAQMHLPAITLETNGLGRFLPALLRRELDAAGLGLRRGRAMSRIASKDQRILDAFDPLLAAGALHAHASVWSTPFIEEMREWRPGAALSRRRPGRRQRLPACRAGAPAALRARPRREWRPGSLARVAPAEFEP